MMIALPTAISAAKYIGAGITCLVGYKAVVKPMLGVYQFGSDFKEILEGRNVEKHGADAPIPVKELAAGLKKAKETLETTPKDAKKIAEEALVSFFSHANHETMVSSSLHRTAENLLENLDSKESLTTCIEMLEKEIEGISGRLTKIKKIAHSLKEKGKVAALDQLRSAIPHPDEPTLHPLEKIRALQKRSDSPLKSRLIRFHLSKIGVNLEGLNGHIRGSVSAARRLDPEGFDTVCKKLGFDRRFFGTTQGNPEEFDRFFIEYDLLRKEKPLLSKLPAEFHWKTETNYETEKQKSVDLASCFAVLVVFKMRYGSDPLTQTGFHTVLSKTHHKSPEDRKKLVLQFLKEERERLGTAWVPWSVDEQVFETVYKLANYSSFQCMTNSPLIDNIKDNLQESPIPSMIYLGEKTSRFFHYFVNKYREWSKSYAYDMTQDDFLKMKLYKRQEQSQGSLNLDFFLSRLDIIGKLQRLSDSMYRWACRPCFGKDHTLTFLNPTLVVFKQLVALPLRFIVQFLKLPALVTQWLLNLIFMSAAEQVLVHTRLFERVDEVVTEAMLNPTPYHFPILEVILKNLKEVLEIIEESSGEPLPSHPETNRAKRALKEMVRTFVAGAKTQESLSTESKPIDQVIFEKVLPPAMDKIYDTILRVHNGFTERENLEKRGTEVLQALNYYIYNKHKPTENIEVLEKRVQEVRKHIALYIKKIAHALIIQTSNEEISEDVGNALKEFLTDAEDAAFSPLTESYLSRNKGLFIDLIRKSYVMKGLFVHLITEDKNPSTQ